MLASLGSNTGSLLLLVALALGGCMGTDSPPPESWWDGVSDLTFASEFGEGVQVAPDPSSPFCFADITGRDAVTGYDWVDSVETGAPFGEVRFYFEGGSDEQRSVALVSDPDDASNTVLLTRIEEPNVRVGQDCATAPTNDPCASAEDHKARIQMVLRENRGLRRFEYQVRVRLGAGFRALHEASLDPDQGPLDWHWLTIGEFWNNLAREEDPFRITLGVHPHANEGLRLVLKADEREPNAEGELAWEELWGGEQVADFEVPIEEWFTLHVALEEGDERTGRATVSLVMPTGERRVLIDVNDITHDPDTPPGELDGFKDVNPVKLYTAGQLVCGLRGEGLPLEIWWDDLAFGGR